MYVFDLEGTISNSKHREHLIPDWDAFHAEFPKDQLNSGMSELMHSCEKNGDVFILTGMMEKHRDMAGKWLIDKGLLHLIKCIYMRPNDCFLSSPEFKRKQILHMQSIYSDRIQMVFDDRLDVVCAMHRISVPAIQVKFGV